MEQYKSEKNKKKHPSGREENDGVRPYSKQDEKKDAH